MNYTDNYNLKQPDYSETADIADTNDNMTTIDSALHTLDTGKKPKQTAKNDPTASGTSATFIATLSQDANGVVTATKKTVQNSSSSQAGLMTSTQYNKLAGIEDQANKYVLPAASSSALGGIKTGFTQQGRYYPVKLSDSSYNAYVNVPWTDTVYTLPAASSSALGGIKTGYTQSGQNYPVQLSSQKAYVNVPWKDTLLTSVVARFDYLMMADSSQLFNDTVIDVPSGYDALGIIKYNTNNGGVFVYRTGIGSSNKLVVGLTNTLDTLASGEFAATILCYKRS